ncbi:SDH family Clp fold serine proteinase [Acinetobacter baumannii]|uniref:SDH family Clp fold serine proteinase n=1 Tax=Acinetobacter baumannii TaxID=470 RepID=UPI000DD061D1|nr:hypothetical protein [Acinetobacter baumannii]MDC5100964.1 hypothetical protein [Acinetobacter baumannii]MDC5507955.1 hypothetical protein [Acinetobacter baumannii]MDP7910765.1 hypothetical protein [Acinetobacter baumannii]QUV69015.1 hypothetical protein KPZ59_01259 [Acinetobacter baumannii]HAV3751331.1 hypothetical protein [Acinetobacter baumannii]
MLEVVPDIPPTLDTDYIVYCGGISRSGYNEITKICKSSDKKKACLVLLTPGGDPDAGYRIARALQHYYDEGFSVLIPSYCKSAGTLICIGANELIIDDKGELGPLDIQLNKSTELGEKTSGLDLPQAFEALRSEAAKIFRETLFDVRMGGRISTKLATEVATNLSSNLLSPIYSQIDPLRMGEMQRANFIAYEYGTRLNDKFKLLKPGALGRLLLSYSSHAFVIDRKELKELFNKVRRPETTNELELLQKLENLIIAFENGSDDNLICNANFLLLENQSNEQKNADLQPSDGLQENDNSEQSGASPNLEGNSQCSSSAEGEDSGGNFRAAE